MALSRSTDPRPAAPVAFGILALAVVATSASAIFIRLASVPPLSLAGWRMAAAALISIPLALHRGGDRNLGRVAPYALLSGLFLALHFGSWITALSMTSVIHATTLVTLHPIGVAALSAVVLGERVTTDRLAAGAAALAGAILLSVSGSSGGVTPTAGGNVLAVLGALAMAGHLLVGRRARRECGVWLYTGGAYGVAAVILLATALLSGQSLGPFEPRDWLMVALLAVVCTIMGHSLFSLVLRWLPAVDVSLAILLEPVIAGVLAYALFGERPGVGTLAGSAIVISALATLVIRSRRGGRSAPDVATLK